jgi:hypothetical protein
MCTIIFTNKYGYGSGSGYCIDLQDANIKQKVFSAYSFLKVHLHLFSKIKDQKEVTKQ